MLFRMVSGVDSRHRVLNGYAHWRHTANTVEQLRAAVMRGSATRSAVGWKIGQSYKYSIATTVCLSIVLFSRCQGYQVLHFKTRVSGPHTSDRNVRWPRRVLPW